jgi:hypothetical protein
MVYQLQLIHSQAPCSGKDHLLVYFIDVKFKLIYFYFLTESPLKPCIYRKRTASSLTSHPTGEKKNSERPSSAYFTHHDAGLENIDVFNIVDLEEDDLESKGDYSPQSNRKPSARKFDQSAENVVTVISPLHTQDNESELNKSNYRIDKANQTNNIKINDPSIEEDDDNNTEIDFEINELLNPRLSELEIARLNED